MKMLRSKFLTTILLFSITTISAANACGSKEKEDVVYENLYSPGNVPVMQKSKKPIESYFDFDEWQNYYINPDYSGNGTVINRPVNSIACKDESTAPYEYDSKLSIPVFYGKYDESNWWQWTFDSSPWSNWSPNNKRVPQSSYIYRGDSALDYQVETRKEYRYCREVRRAKYKKRYVTRFRGSKWWNCLITYTVYDDHRYQSAPANFRVISTYTEEVYDGTYPVTEYDYTWRTNPLGLGFFGAGYRPWDSRTSYRFRHRTVKWNERGYEGRETIPLYYSIFNREGSPIKKGIMLESDTELSGSYAKSGEIKSDYYKTKCIYIPTSVISEQIIYDIIMNHSDSDQISTLAYGLLSASPTGLGWLITFLAEKFSKKELMKSFLKLSMPFSVFSLLLNVANYQSSQNKKLEIENFANILEHIDDYNLLSISYTYNNPVGIPFISKIPQHFLSAKLVDKKNTSSDDIKYISMDFLQNKEANNGSFIPYLQFDDCKSYYGKISYMDDYSNLYKVAEDYFTSFDIYDFTTWFN